MFSDMLLLKTQLFHTVWPAVDIIPLASVACVSTTCAHGGGNSSDIVGAKNYYPVSSESSVSCPAAVCAEV